MLALEDSETPGDFLVPISGLLFQFWRGGENLEQVYA